MIKPREFKKTRDCNIYKIIVEDIVYIDDDKIETKNLRQLDFDDFWFLIKIECDGKTSTGRYKHRYHWIEYVYYAVHKDFEKYHFVVDWAVYTPWAKDSKLRCAQGAHLISPTLGPKNKIKIKLAVKKFLSSL